MKYHFFLSTSIGVTLEDNIENINISIFLNISQMVY